MSSSSSSPFSNFSPRRTLLSRPFQLPLASKGNGNESNSPQSDSKDINSLPILSNRPLSLSPLSKDMAMGLVLNAAAGRGWTTVRVWKALQSLQGLRPARALRTCPLSHGLCSLNRLAEECLWLLLVTFVDRGQHELLTDMLIPMALSLCR
ncbi:hypothetical protein SLA2020_270520 [Shorea laevis]